MPLVMISTVTRMRVNGGCPFIQSRPLCDRPWIRIAEADYRVRQLISVISLLSSDTPNTDSPANVDAAKEVRTDLAGTSLRSILVNDDSQTDIAYKKKVRRLVRRSAEEAL